MRKVAVIGAGNVGATCAQRIIEKNLADVVLVDIVEGLAAGKALDMMQSAPIEGFTARITGTTDFAAIAGSEIVVVTAGLARKPGMSRDDLLFKNAEIMEGITRHIVAYAPQSIVIIVTNPLDVMSYLVFKKSGFPANRIIGMAGVLDSARCQFFVSEALQCPPSTVQAMVLGGHGDTMVPVVDQITQNGTPARETLGGDVLGKIIERTKNGGAEIVALLKSGSAFYAPASSTVAMVKSILCNEKKTLPCAAYLTGEYGLRDIFFGVPVVLGKTGIQSIVELPLSASEKKSLHSSADSVHEQIKKLKF